jgi:hypothetical protein
MIFLLLIFSGLCPETHSLFAKREAKTLIRLLGVRGRSQRKLKFAQRLHVSLFKKWWGWATPDYNHPDFAKAVLIA